jgi:hypothetical protein
LDWLKVTPESIIQPGQGRSGLRALGSSREIIKSSP